MIFSVKNAPDTAVLDEFCEGNALILPLKPQKFIGAFGADLPFLDPLLSISTVIFQFDAEPPLVFKMTKILGGFSP